MRKSTTKPRRKKAPKQVLALPDLEQSKAAVLNSSQAPVGRPAAVEELVATWTQMA